MLVEPLQAFHMHCRNLHQLAESLQTTQQASLQPKDLWKTPATIQLALHLSKLLFRTTTMKLASG